MKSKIEQWLAASPLGSFVKVFVAWILGAAVADWATSGSIDFGAWQTWVIGALVSAVPILINWLNPADGRYGRGSEAPPAE